MKRTWAPLSLFKLMTTAFLLLEVSHSSAEDQFIPSCDHSPFEATLGEAKNQIQLALNAAYLLTLAPMFPRPTTPQTPMAPPSISYAPTQPIPVDIRVRKNAETGQNEIHFHDRASGQPLRVYLMSGKRKSGESYGQAEIGSGSIGGSIDGSRFSIETSKQFFELISRKNNDENNDRINESSNDGDDDDTTWRVVFLTEQNIEIHGNEVSYQPQGVLRGVVVPTGGSPLHLEIKGGAKIPLSDLDLTDSPHFSVSFSFRKNF
jgi:hypothetical protein